MWNKFLQFLGIRPYPEIRFGDAAVAAQYAAVEKEHPRSPKWPAVRDAWIAQHPTCAVCGKGGKAADLNVHHRRPYHLFPELELDPHGDNLITLCNVSLHHLWFGHYGDFREGYNLAVIGDAAAFLAKMSLRESGGVVA